MTELNQRRKSTEEKHQDFLKKLSGVQGIVAGKACVYATGSYGRKEAGQKSDLDLFIVGLDRMDEKKSVIGSVLKNLDVILIKSALIETTRGTGIPDFDGDGKYLTDFYVTELTETLGTPKDDASNTFAARLLLLLESTPILEKNVYDEVIGNVITRYWRDFPDHSADFIPAFLANDILRLWRTFCVSYEANPQIGSLYEKAKRRTKNYKLKHSRMLTCYSALLYLLAIYSRSKTVRPEDAISMVHLSPTERLEWLLRRDDISQVHRNIKVLLQQYDKFLVNTSIGDEALIKKFEKKSDAISYMADAFSFGDTMSNVLQALGQSNRFGRLVLV